MKPGMDDLTRAGQIRGWSRSAGRVSPRLGTCLACEAAATVLPAAGRHRQQSGQFRQDLRYPGAAVVAAGHSSATWHNDASRRTT